MEKPTSLNKPVLYRTGRSIPPYETIVETSDTHICDYAWLLNLATCAMSVCTLLVVIIFFIWAATRGIVLNN
mgnify:CR=1 FL=1|jgi:hypothetical protein